MHSKIEHETIVAVADQANIRLKEKDDGSIEKEGKKYKAVRSIVRAGGVQI